MTSRSLCQYTPAGILHQSEKEGIMRGFVECLYRDGKITVDQYQTFQSIQNVTLAVFLSWMTTWGQMGVWNLYMRTHPRLEQTVYAPSYEKIQQNYKVNNRTFQQRGGTDASVFTLKRAVDTINKNNAEFWREPYMTKKVEKQCDRNPSLLFRINGRRRVMCLRQLPTGAVIVSPSTPAMVITGDLFGGGFA